MGKSLLELRKEYGVGSSGFYNQSWYDNELFAKEKPEAGEYDIDFGEDIKNLTFAEQKTKLKKGFSVAHPAVVAEAILAHLKKTGERLCGTHWVRTSLVGSDGDRVLVRFGAVGVHVGNGWDDGRSGDVDVASARKSTKNLDAGTLEPRESLTLEEKARRYDEINKIIYNTKR